MQSALLRTWVEISKSAAKKNYDTFRRLTDKKTQLWAVVKSNAYGHGLLAFSGIMDEFGVDGFCVDSILEGMALRRAGIIKKILVLGPTLPAQLPSADKAGIAVSVSCFEDLAALAKLKDIPEFHIKIDTGMHRRGFYPEDTGKIIKYLYAHKALKPKLTGIFTHFASAKDINYPTYTDLQFDRFRSACAIFRKAGYKLTEHASATGGTLISKKYHFDAVRIGIGLYGLWPSKELEVQLGDKIFLYPVLSWKAYVTETKKLKKGDFVGYDLTERVLGPSVAAVLPVGYWHGVPRSLSSSGEVLINGKRARILGRVSMDLIVVDAGACLPKVGNIAVLIGKEKDETISAGRLAELSGTSHYEYITRLNPLMERKVVK